MGFAERPHRHVGLVRCSAFGPRVPASRNRQLHPYWSPCFSWVQTSTGCERLMYSRTDRTQTIHSFGLVSDRAARSGHVRSVGFLIGVDSNSRSNSQRCDADRPIIRAAPLPEVLPSQNNSNPYRRSFPISFSLTSLFLSMGASSPLFVRCQRLFRDVNPLHAIGLGAIPEPFLNRSRTIPE